MLMRKTAPEYEYIKGEEFGRSARKHMPTSEQHFRSFVQDAHDERDEMAQTYYLHTSVKDRSLCEKKKRRECTTVQRLKKLQEGGRVLKNALTTARSRSLQGLEGVRGWSPPMQ